MHLIRQPHGQRPTEYTAEVTGKSEAWKWSNHLGGGYSAIGRTPEEAEMLLRDAIAYGRCRVSLEPTEGSHASY